METGFFTEESIIAENINQYTKCFQEIEDKFQCLVQGCGKKLSEKSAAIRHLKTVHPEITKAINGLKGVDTTKNRIEIKSKTNLSSFWNAIVQLIVFCALPFEIVQSKGFQYLIKPHIDAFKRVGVQFAVNPKNITEQIEEKTKLIKERIISEVKGNTVCLMLDIASRYNRSIFGINIVYWSNGKQCIRTIGMYPVKISQTGKNLFDLVKNRLAEFGISLQQVFAVTTDNGKNLIKMVKIMQKELSGIAATYDISDEESDDDEVDGTFPFENEDQEDCHLDPEIFNDEYFEDLLSNLLDEFDCEYKGFCVGISCAAHGLHLVVKEAIKNSTGINELIEKCRTLVKKLRTPSLRGALKEKNQKNALIDVKTRWSSLYNMVSVYIVKYFHSQFDFKKIEVFRNVFFIRSFI